MAVKPDDCYWSIGILQCSTKIYSEHILNFVPNAFSFFFWHLVCLDSYSFSFICCSL